MTRFATFTPPCYTLPTVLDRGGLYVAINEETPLRGSKSSSFACEVALTGISLARLIIDGSAFVLPSAYGNNFRPLGQEIGR